MELKTISHECNLMLERQLEVFNKEHQEDVSDIFVDMKILVKGGELINSLIKSIDEDTVFDSNEINIFLEIVLLKSLKKYGYEASKNMLFSAMSSQAYTSEFILSALQDLNDKYFQGIHDLKKEEQSIILIGSIKFIKNAILCGLKEEESYFKESFNLIKMAEEILKLKSK